MIDDCLWWPAFLKHSIFKLLSKFKVWILKFWNSKILYPFQSNSKYCSLQKQLLFYNSWVNISIHSQFEMWGHVFKNVKIMLILIFEFQLKLKWKLKTSLLHGRRTSSACPTAWFMSAGKRKLFISSFETKVLTFAPCIYANSKLR